MNFFKNKNKIHRTAAVCHLFKGNHFPVPVTDFAAFCQL